MNANTTKHKGANMTDELTDNGGWPIAYVDVDEYNAMCQRAEAAEATVKTNEARIAELTRLKDELAEDASNFRQRAEAAEAKLAALAL